jgi:hypothetical protein
LLQTLVPREKFNDVKTISAIPNIESDFVERYEELKSFAVVNPRTLSVRSAAKEFVSSDTVFLISATYPLQEIGALGDNSDLGVVLFPKVKYQPVPIYYMDGLVLGKKCINNEVCEKFGNFILTNEAQRSIISHVGGIPPGKDYDLGRPLNEFETFGLRWIDKAMPPQLYCMEYFLPLLAFEIDKLKTKKEKIEKFKNSWKDLVCFH